MKMDIQKLQDQLKWLPASWLARMENIYSECLA
jgi:hypothetical protein